MTKIAVTTQYTPAEPEIEIAAIRNLVATVERVQQHERVEEFVALFRGVQSGPPEPASNCSVAKRSQTSPHRCYPVGPLRATAPVTRSNTCSSYVPMSPP